MSTKRIISIALVLVLAAALLCGCKATDAKAAVLVHDGRRVKVDTIMTVGDFEVSLDLYRYYFCSVRNDRDAGDSDYWDEHIDEEAGVMDETLEAIKSLYATIALADKYGIELSEDELKSVKAQVNSTIDSLGSYDAFINALESNWMTEDVYEFMITNETLAEQLYSALTAEGGELYVTGDQMTGKVEDEFVRVRHIFVSSDTEDARDKIDEAAAAIKGGKSFEDAMKEYSEAYTEPAEGSTDDGSICFAAGYMNEDFEAAAFALDEGDISGVVETEYGYHIIERMELDTDYVTENLDTITSEYQQVKYGEMQQELAEAAGITFAPEYDYIGVETLS